ncbi:hypothetical protein C7I84_26300 [Mesorhizobium ephedrae]|uniref:Uncharacterized protein n=1 Tax=Kumtagia ephedrae TaxID=2116701 RepID=A0A2P7RR91_9HYPH|nr:hypothetical protein C7I84_26300 [Mesorhizobium ephedrae]
MRHKGLFSILLLAGAVGAAFVLTPGLADRTSRLLATDHGVRAADAGHQGPRAATVTTAVASTADFPIRRYAIGFVTSPAVVEIGARVSSQVTAIKVKDGQMVKAGDVLLQLDDRALQAAVDRDQAMLDKDQALLVSAQADLGRAKDLVATRIGTQQSYDQALAAEKSAAATVAADQAQLDADKVQLGFATITAPIAGRLGQVNTTIGDLVGPNTGGTAVAALVTITQMDPLEVQFDLPEKELGLLQKGLASPAPPTVMLHKDDDPTPIGTGTVDFIDSSVDTASGTFAVKATVPNPGLTLWPRQGGEPRHRRRHAALDALWRLRHRADLDHLRLGRQLSGDFGARSTHRLDAGAHPVDPRAHGQRQPGADLRLRPGRAHRRAADGQPARPAAGGDDLLQSAARRGAGRHGHPHRRAETADRDAADDLDHLRRHGQDLPGFAGQPGFSDRRRHPDHLYRARHPLREFCPPADDPDRPAVGGGRRAAGADAGRDGRVDHRHHRHADADRHRQEERHHDGRRGAESQARGHGAGRGDPPRLPDALPADHDDDAGRADGHAADRARRRRQRRAAPAAGRRRGRRPAGVAGADAVHHAGDLRLHGAAFGLAAAAGAVAGAKAGGVGQGGFAGVTAGHMRNDSTCAASYPHP